MQTVLTCLALIAAVPLVATQAFEESLTDPANDVRELSKPNKYKCALYFMGPLTKPEEAAYLRTLPLDLDAVCVNGKVPSDSLKKKYAKKCQDLVNSGLSGKYSLNSPSPIKGEDSTIGAYWCKKVIGKNGCGFQYSIFLSTCGSPMEDTGLRGPEPVCCKYNPATQVNAHVACRDWTPIKKGAPVPAFCRPYVFPDSPAESNSEPKRPAANGTPQ